MVNRWGFQLANQKRGRNSLDQSEERRDFKMRDFKNVKVILLRDLRNLSGGVFTNQHLSEIMCFFLYVCTVTTSTYTAWYLYIVITHKVRVHAVILS